MRRRILLTFEVNVLVTKSINQDVHLAPFVSSFPFREASWADSKWSISRKFPLFVELNSPLFVELNFVNAVLPSEWPRKLTFCRPIHWQLLSESSNNIYFLWLGKHGDLTLEIIHLIVHGCMCITAWVNSQLLTLFSISEHETCVHEFVSTCCAYS